MTIAKGAVLRGINQGFHVEDLEWDEPRDDEVGIRVIACGVCHTDWHCAAGNTMVNYPCLTGHEGGGIVEKVGKNVKRVKAGDKVVMSWMPSCGHCPSCVSGQGHLCDRGANLLVGDRDDGSFRIKDKAGHKVDQVLFLGAFSEYVVIPEDGCIPVDSDLDLLKIPVVGCRVPTGWGSVVNVAKAKQGCTALVIGLGGVGFNILQGLKCVGASVVIAADIHDKKRWAMEWGATHYVDCSKQDVVAEVMNITGIGVDYAFDGIGNIQLQRQTVDAIKKGGTAVWVGVTPKDAEQRSVVLDSKVLTLWQKKVSGSLYGGASPFEMVPQLVKMYKSGKIKFDQLITKYYKLDQLNEAFEDMLAGRNICGCVRMD